MPYHHAFAEHLPYNGLECGGGCACRRCSPRRPRIRIQLGEPPAVPPPPACAPSRVPNRVDVKETQRRQVACNDTQFAVVVRAATRAIAMLNETIGQLETARNEFCAGTAPTLSAIMREWLPQRLGICIDNPAVWRAGSYTVGSVAEVMRRLMAIRNLIGGGHLRYSCTSPSCGDEWAFVTVRGPDGNCDPGTPMMLIRLCRRFFVPGIVRATGLPVDAAVHAEFQAQTLIHESSHLTHCNPENGPGASIGVAECVAQFVAATNGSPLDPDFATHCARTTRCGPAPAPVGAMRPMRRPVGALAGYGQPFHGVILGVKFRPENAVYPDGRPVFPR